jgi:predicted ATPase
MIHRLRIQNFKSIIDVEVELSSVTVLVGKSGTGKSNFVDAIRCLRDLLVSGQMGEKWSQIQPATKSNAALYFELEFSISGIGETFEYALSVEHGKVLPSEERLSLGQRLLFHQSWLDNQTNQPKWLVEPNLLKVPTPGKIALGQIPSISEIVIAFTAITSGIGCYDFPDTVLCGSKNNKSGAGLDDEASNYLGTLKEIVSNLQDLSVRKGLVTALQRINPSVSSLELNSIQQPSHAIVGHRFDGKTLALQLPQESDGFRRFCAYLLALYQRPPKQTLVFEHPEDGIHPGALAVLAEEFKAAPASGRGQVILTTHSPILLDHFDVEQIRVVELKGFETQIGLVSSEQRDAIRENLLDTGELLTVDPARIEMPAPEAAGA